MRGVSCRFLQSTNSDASPGFKRVSDYEEEESLRRAIQESASSFPADTQSTQGILDHCTAEGPPDPHSSEEAEEDLPDMSLTSGMNHPLAKTSSYELEKLYLGSRWWQLPHEIVDDIARFLGDVDMLGYLRMLSKTPVFCASEKVYKELCQRIYLAQTGNTVAESAYLRFHSWRNMLIHRPRIRTNGIYSVDSNYKWLLSIS